MKKSILFLLIIITTCSLSVQATIRTVSNNPGSPGQYTNLQTAIDAAGFNDTILIAGSTTSYGNITFGKPLVLIGAGYNNPYGANTTIAGLTLTRQTFYVSSSGTKIMGIYFQDAIYLNGVYTGGTMNSQTLDNLVFERCKISSLGFGTSGGPETFNYDTIRNCLITGSISSYNYYNYNGPNEPDIYNNIMIHNNIFNGGYFNFGYYDYPNSYAVLSKFYVKNNLLLNNSTNCFTRSKNMIIENNIFYGAEPQGGTGCVFTKNLTYMCVNNTIPGAANLGSGNKVNQNPLFVNVPPQGGFSYTYDYHLQAGSPGKNAGTDGTDIGIYGGMMPFEVGANPYIPQMMETTLPGGSSVPAGGTLNLHFKARKQN